MEMDMVAILKYTDRVGVEHEVVYEADEHGRLLEAMKIFLELEIGFQVNYA
jgi:hypothetical protein